MSHNDLVLGKPTHYFEEYNPSVLFPIARNQGRSSLSLPPFTGYDLWRVYELTYLTSQGLPQSKMATLRIPCTSPYIVESKSLKLYLGSFCQTMFGSEEEAAQIIAHDLEDLLDASDEVKLYDIERNAMPIIGLSGTLLEKEPAVADARFKTYEVDPSLLKLQDKAQKVSESLVTNIFRSLCPVTSQPDYASIEISYSGEQFDHLSLLSYLVSFRRHQGFHEQCVEQIFNAFHSRLKPDELTVTACFTRRGGIDISPVRSNAKSYNPPVRTPRQ